MSTVDDIKSRIDIVEYVSQYVQLKKAGYNYKGLCPFHKEKSPSFMVSPDKGIAYCFGCRKGGDVFAFAMEIEHVDFVDALRSLAKRTGVTLEDYKSEDVDKKQRLYRMQEVAQVFYEEKLAAAEAVEARAYVEKRGMGAEDVKAFGIGYAPDSYDALLRRLRDKGFTEAEIRESGLVTLKEGSSDVYDKFRDRITFPLRNADGDIVGFAGRAMKDDQQPKYLNSPETALYHKGDILYNFSQARNAIREKESALIVEGYMDAIACHQAGVTNVVAVCGTAMTERQAKLLKRHCPTAIFCFDNDAAGLSASARNAVPVLREGLIAKSIDLGSHKDPDAFYRADPEAFRQAVHSPSDLIETLIAKFEKHYNLQVPEGRRAFLTEIAPLIQSLPLSSEQESYAKRIATLFGNTVESILSDLRRVKSVHTSAEHKTEPAESGSQKRRRLVLGILLNHPEWMTDCIEQISDEMFAEGFEKNVYSMLLTSYNQRVTVSDALVGMDEKDRSEAHILSLETEDAYAESNADQLRVELGKLLTRMREEKQLKSKEEYLSRLRSLEKSDPEAHWKLLQEFSQRP